ncbi:M14-type cytosolic carboxypeptidase [Ectopseudomonas hydrolytica]|uniref:M14-type cytosolic carboxypeptidase n=1 Tax=Ectopseudomonas hydrolytica TaxID=2493633 RepID=A0ABY5A6C5_9GAMM|nr:MULTISPECIES: M14-type cytosolic carboxypeptidase [Pseudomonas]MDH0096640.1 M14-type cytosolic carboxypeptidase [Pseudomonas sp. GD04158]USR38503.1 M14-type cytosolic carboxypeptidase [Pseudomonas hydrolytica]
MKISADFDSGNIQVIDASDPLRVQLAMRPDLNSYHFQWFHFRVEGLQPGQRHAFSLTNAGQSAYNKAWDGYQAVASYDQQDWFRVPTRFEDGQLHFELLAEREQAWFAYFEPYPRARHERLVAQALERGAELVACGRSLEGRDIQLLRIGAQAAAPSKLWLIAQQHPGEHMAEWFMEGLIERLQDPHDAEVQALLSQAEFYLIPNMNPDGAFRGHLRTNLAGQDLNRAWQSASVERSPEVLFALQHMQRIGVDLFLDIHGDEEIPHVFTAGCEGNPGYTPRLAALEEDFRQRLVSIGAEFQTRFGYPRDEPGQANLTLACNAVGEAFDCLSFTIEMPFKDHDDNPQPRTGWNGARSKKLGQDVLTVLAQMVGRLR